MLVLLFSLFSQAEEPSASIVVSDSRYEEIYFEEPRVIYVVSRKGSEDLILQGCRVEEIVGNDCKISFTRYQSA